MEMPQVGQSEFHWLAAHDRWEKTLFQKRDNEHVIPLKLWQIAF